jgi:hypothetical protein
VLSDRIGALLGTEPATPPFTHPPVFIAKSNIVVSWSPKGGCSHVVLWAFIHEGHFAAASAADVTPHRFRIHNYQKLDPYQRALRRLRRSGGVGHTLVKVTRDPKKRLVSIFRHACRRRFLQRYRDILGFDPQVEGLSLADLDRLLGALRLTHPTTDDPHLRVQSNPLWDFDYDRVITLNMDERPLDPGLNAIEASLGLPVTDFAARPAFARLRRAHYAEDGVWDEPRDLATFRFRPDEFRAFPKTQILALPLLEDMARRHYAVDYGRVGSADSAGRLFQEAGPLGAA